MDVDSRPHNPLPKSRFLLLLIIVTHLLLPLMMMIMLHNTAHVAHSVNPIRSLVMAMTMHIAGIVDRGQSAKEHATLLPLRLLLRRSSGSAGGWIAEAVEGVAAAGGRVVRDGLGWLLLLRGVREPDHDDFPARPYSTCCTDLVSYLVILIIIYVIAAPTCHVLRHELYRRYCMSAPMRL